MGLARGNSLHGVCVAREKQRLVEALDFFQATREATTMISHVHLDSHWATQIDLIIFEPREDSSCCLKQ
jgi:hypothetical protein